MTCKSREDLCGPSYGQKSAVPRQGQHYNLTSCYLLPLLSPPLQARIKAPANDISVGSSQYASAELPPPLPLHSLSFPGRSPAPAVVGGGAIVSWVAIHVLNLFYYLFTCVAEKAHAWLLRSGRYWAAYGSGGTLFHSGLRGLKC